MSRSSSGARCPPTRTTARRPPSRSTPRSGASSMKPIARALTILKDNLQNLHNLSECLIEKENLTGAEVDEIIAAGTPIYGHKPVIPADGEPAQSPSDTRPDNERLPGEGAADRQPGRCAPGAWPDQGRSGRCRHDGTQDADPLHQVVRDAVPSGQHPQAGDAGAGRGCRRGTRDRGMQYR